MSVNVFIPKGSIFGVILNIVMIAFLLYAIIIKGKYHKEFAGIYLYVLLLSLLILIQSSDYLYSFRNFARYLFGLLCLPVGFNILSSLKKFRDFQKTGIVIMILYIVNIIIVNLFNLGSTSGYGGDGLEIGNLFSDALYANIYVITSIFLLLLLFPDKKRVILILSAICAILVVVNMKRTTILVLAVGLVLYLFLYFVNNRFKSRLTLMHKKYLSWLFVLALIVTPFFYGYIQINLALRQNSFENAREDITQEGRVAEFIYISDDILNSNNLLTILFGQETFNLVGTYAGGRFGDRQIHGDYSALLNGAGVIGVLMWLLIHIYLVIWMIRLRRSAHCRDGAVASILYPLYFSFLIIYVVSMVSGVFGASISSAYFYTSLGGMLRYFYNRSQYVNFRRNSNEKLIIRRV